MSEHRKVLLVGNPNVGKSVVFSRLTGVHVVASNYPGTTVEFTQGNMKVGDEWMLLVDVPGIYSLEASSEAEEVAVRMVEEGDLIINVVDATNLERNLFLTLQLLELGKPMLIALNMWDDAAHRGIEIDVDALEEMLGVPVVPTVAVTGEGINVLVDRLREAIAPSPRYADVDLWVAVGNMIRKVQRLHRRHHTLAERIADASIHPLTGFPMLVTAAVGVFWVVRTIGEGLIGHLMDPLFTRLYLPLLERVASRMEPGSLLHQLLIGALVDGRIDFLQSFGMLSSGLYVPLAMVLPYVIAFYFVLGLLEDVGYLPRVVVLMDNAFHRLGLHGWAAIPMFLGFGCNVPAVLATRSLESYRQRFIAVTMLSIGVPCTAMQAVVIKLLGDVPHGGWYILLVYASLLVVGVAVGFVLNRVMRGRSPELIMEVPPYRMPSIAATLKKLWFRVKGFILEAVPVVLLGLLLINLFQWMGLFDLVVRLAAPVLTRVLGLPAEAVRAIVFGFLRKDMAAAMLASFSLEPSQLVVATVVISMFFPCIATFVVVTKELGWWGMVKSVFVMVIASIVAGGILNLLV